MPSAMLIIIVPAMTLRAPVPESGTRTPPREAVERSGHALDGHIACGTLHVAHRAQHLDHARSFEIALEQLGIRRAAQRRTFGRVLGRVRSPIGAEGAARVRAHDALRPV